MTDEKFLLGQIILDNKIFYKTDLTTDHFSSQETKKIFLAISDLISQNINVDIMTLSDESYNLSPTTLSKLSGVPSAANWSYYYNKVVKAYKRRKLEMIDLALRDNLKTMEPDEILKDLEEKLETLYSPEKTERNSKDLTFEAIETIEKRYKSQGQFPGISTGIRGLDDHLLGFQKRKLYYIGARPSQGKSALMLNLVNHISIVEKKKVGVISLESSSKELMLRLFSINACIDSTNISTGCLSKSDFIRLTDAAEKLHQANIIFDDQTNLNADQIRHKIKKMVIVHKVDIVFIDYLQLVSGGNDKYRRDEIRKVSVEMKNIARRNNIPVICLAQLNRDSDNKRPRLGNFAESSQIEKDADAAILIWNDENETWFLLDKNRDGRTGPVPVVFKKEYVKFTQKEYRKDD